MTRRVGFGRGLAVRSAGRGVAVEAGVRHERTDAVVVEVRGGRSRRRGLRRALSREGVVRRLAGRRRTWPAGRSSPPFDVLVQMTALLRIWRRLDHGGSVPAIDPPQAVHGSRTPQMPRTRSGWATPDRFASAGAGHPTIVANDPSSNTRSDVSAGGPERDLRDQAIDDVFDRPALWRAEAAGALDLADDDLPAAMSPGPTFPVALRSAIASLPDDISTVVDLGAGAGGASEWVRSATGAEVIAVEPAPRARLAAQLLFPDLVVLDGAADRAPLADGCADVVTLWGVLSLLDDVGPVLSEASRLLTGDGWLVVADVVSAGDTGWNDEDNRFRSVEELEALIHGHGFLVADIGCGAMASTGRWADTAHRVDEWIEEHCADRDGFDRWRDDQRKLGELADGDAVMGGVLVARRRARPRLPLHAPG